MGMMIVFWEPNCWTISCWPRFPSLTWATVLCQRLLPGYSSPSAQGHLEVAEYVLSPTYPLMCWIYPNKEKRRCNLRAYLRNSQKEAFAPSSSRSRNSRSSRNVFIWEMGNYWSIIIRPQTAGWVSLIFRACFKHSLKVAFTVSCWAFPAGMHQRSRSNEPRTAGESSESSESSPDKVFTQAFCTCSAKSSLSRSWALSSSVQCGTALQRIPLVVEPANQPE